MSSDQKKPTTAKVIDMFRALNLPVTNDVQQIETKGKELNGLYLRMKGSTDPHKRIQADEWFKTLSCLRSARDRLELLGIVRDHFTHLADTALETALAGTAPKTLTPDLYARLKHFAVKECRCDDPLAQRFVDEYLRKRKLELGKPILYPRLPDGLTATSSMGKVELCWRLPAANCDEVIVRRFQVTTDGKSKGAGQELCRGRRAGFTDQEVKAGQRCRYEVYSVLRGEESQDKASVEVVTIDEVTDVRARWEKDHVKLSWKKPAPDCEVLVFGASSPIALAQGSLPEPRSGNPEAKLIFRGTEKAEYDDIGSMEWEEYHYLLVAFFAPYSFSRGVSVSIRTPIPPPPVKSVEAKYGEGKVRIRWEPVRSAQQVRYIVVRTPGATPAASPEEDEPIATTRRTSCSDKNIENGKQYTYTVFTLREVPSRQGCSAKPVAIVADVREQDLAVEEGDGAVTLRWEKPPEAHRVIVRRGLKRIAHPDDGELVSLAGPGLAPDTDLSNDQKYHYLLCCSYLIGGEEILSPGVRRTVTPHELPGEVASLDVNQEGNQAVCTWDLDGPGTVAVVRTSNPPPYKVDAMLTDQKLGELGHRLSVSGTNEATDTSPTPAEPYYTAFVVAGSYVRAGPWKKCVVTEDVSHLHLKSEAEGVRLRWVWPDQCTAVVIARRKDEMPTGIDDPLATTINCSRIDYEQNHNSFLDRNAGKDKVCYVVYARPHDAPERVYSPGLAPDCQGCVHPASFGQLSYSLQVKRKRRLIGPQMLLLKWRFDVRPSVFSGFRLVGNVRVAPSEPAGGTELFRCAPGDPEWESQKASIPLNETELKALDDGDLYCRLFHLNPDEQRQILVIHPDLSVPCGHPVTRSAPREFEAKPPDEVVCPDCLEVFPLIDPSGHNLLDGRCPACGRKLPWSAGRQPGLIIGMVGAKYSGKSHYVATLVERLQRQGWRDFAAGLMHVDDYTKDRYKDEFFAPLYDHKVELPATQSGAKPLLYSFRVDGSIWGRREPDHAVTLALYDTAGEDFASADAVDHFVKYLSRASGLIFLIDPLQIPTVRQMVGAAAKLPEIHPAGNPHEILGTVIGQLQRHGIVSSDRKLDIPVAIVFTKCDVLRDMELIENSRLWHSDVHHYRQYNLTLHDDVNGFIGQLMARWSPDTYGTISAWFANHAMFGISATGCASDEDGRFPYISPWRVEDPLLWLLHQLGVIPGGGS